MMDCIPIFKELSCQANRNLLSFSAIASLLTGLFIFIAIRKNKKCVSPKQEVKA